jgi:hypothetical protein
MTEARITMEGPLHHLMSAMSGNEDQEPEVHPILPLAQAMELRDRFRRAQIEAGLYAGMLCREKPGLGVLTSQRLIMFWRWLDPADTQDALIIADVVRRLIVNRVDCMVGYLDHDGHIEVTTFESWRLEPCDEFDAESPP